MRKQSSSEGDRTSRSAIATPTTNLKVFKGRAIYQSGFFAYGIEGNRVNMREPYFTLQFAEGVSRYNQNDHMEYFIDRPTAKIAFSILMDHFFGELEEPQPTRLAWILGKLPCFELSEISKCCFPGFSRIMHYIDLLIELLCSPVFVLWDILGLTTTSIAHYFFKAISYLCCCEISYNIRHPSLSKRMFLQAAFMLGIVSNISGLPWAWDAGTRVPFLPDALDPIMGAISATVWLSVNQFIQVNTMSLLLDFFIDLPKQLKRLSPFWKFLYISKAAVSLIFAMIASIPTIPQTLDAPHLSHLLKVLSLIASYFSSVILGFRSMVNIIDFSCDQFLSVTTRCENLSLAAHLLDKLETIVPDDSLRFSFQTRIAHAQGDDHFWISLFNIYSIGFLVWLTLGYTRIAYYLPALELGGPIMIFAIMSWFLNTGLFSKTWSLGFVNRLLGNFIAWLQGKETIATEPFFMSDIVVLFTTAISLLNGEARVSHYSGLGYGEAYFTAFRGAFGINSNAQAVGWGSFREARWDVYGETFKEFVRRIMRNVTRKNSLARALYIEHKEKQVLCKVVDHDEREFIPLIDKIDHFVPLNGISETITMIRPQAFLVQLVSWLIHGKPSTQEYDILKPEVLNALMVIHLLQEHNVNCEQLYQEARAERVNPNLRGHELFSLPRHSTGTFMPINDEDEEMTPIAVVAGDYSH